MDLAEELSIGSRSITRYDLWTADECFLTELQLRLSLRWG